MEMRKVMANCIADAMEKDERVCIIDADLAKANGTFSLREKFPERAFDAGISEQNMASMAAGLSTYGMIPFISTFTPFASRRICDQLAVSVAYAQQNVKIIATDPGLSAQMNGGTHMSVEDIGVVRSIPTMTIFEPTDANQLKQAFPYILNEYGPVYIRLFRKDYPDVLPADYKFNWLKADVLKEGTDLTLIASGIMVKEALEAAETLKEKGMNVEVVNVHTVKPIDRETIIASAKKTGKVITCENHNVIGGLYSAVAEVLSEECPTPMKKIGIQDRFGQVGNLDELMVEYSMKASDIVETALSF